ncbi:tyrosine-type recombinase/integrase [Achromobacter spanius]|uniref:Uncharacterized protein n=1 Tax=Achromobacter spanius TaxID=217203 RepID=A0A2S0I5P9_9BURK|nr:tyrosine-type recombinase/integrase [Achromobacter spanius]AVJ27338.1 hypothetical protein CLM73_09570 [Achromobacter spanius]
MKSNLAPKPGRSVFYGEQRNPEIASTRFQALESWSLESLWQISEENLVTLKEALRHGDEFDVWSTPSEWTQPGRFVNGIALRKRILSFVPSRWLGHSCVDGLVHSAVVQAVRYLCLLRLGPAGQGGFTFRVLSPTSLQGIAYNPLPALLGIAVGKRLQMLSANGIRNSDVSAQSEVHLANVTLDDIECLSLSKKNECIIEANRMKLLEGFGLWRDAPLADERALTKALGDARKHNNKLASRPHLPLPDDYVAALGARCLWIAFDLGPNVIRLTKAVLLGYNGVWASDLHPGTISNRRANVHRAVLDGAIFTDSRGKVIESPPFPFRLPEPKGFGANRGGPRADSEAWKPQSAAHLIKLMWAIQAAHMCIVFLSTGCRLSELLALKSSALVSPDDGHHYMNGKIFKHVRNRGGAEFEWAIPEVAAKALNQQAEIIDLAERLYRQRREGALPPVKQVADKKLWGRVSIGRANDPTMPMGDATGALKTFAGFLSLDPEPGGQKLRSHRFRKTLARLMALALTQAPTILMQVFGHKSIEMTMGYVLTDRGLRGEIEKVSRELRVMRAASIVSDMVEQDIATPTPGAGYGGNAAAAIHEAVVQHQARVHRRAQQWGIDCATELAEILTLQGQAWEQVRQGVICTKFPNETGPCNRRKGRPEPSRCSSECAHRLEEAFLREDVIGVLEAAVTGYEIATSNGETLVAAHWAGQIRSNIGRFHDVRSVWESNPVVIKIMGLDRRSREE